MDLLAESREERNIKQSTGQLPHLKEESTVDLLAESRGERNIKHSMGWPLRLREESTADLLVESNMEAPGPMQEVVSTGKLDPTAEMDTRVMKDVRV